MKNHTNRISKILLKSSKVSLDNIVKFDNLSGSDKEFYNLWKEYAPRNQTFNQFKEMADNDLSKMRFMVKGWKSRSEKIKECQTLDVRIDDAQQKLKDLLEKNGIPNFWLLFYEHPDVNEEIRSNSEVRAIYNLLNDLIDKRNDIINTSNYSTFNPNFCRYDQIINDFTKSIKSEADQEYKKYKSKCVGGNYELFQHTDEWNNLVSKYINWLGQVREKKYYWEIADQFYMENLGNVVNEYANGFAEVINSDLKIKKQFNSDVWKKLDLDDRVGVLQQIVDMYAKKFGTPLARVYVKEFGSVSFKGKTMSLAECDAFVLSKMNFKYDKNVMSINIKTPNAIALELRNVINNDNPAVAIHAIAHEYGHIVDCITPNEGAVGEQFMHNAFYRVNKETYRIELTEQSSFKIGPCVARKVLGTKNRYYGREFDLELAKKTNSKIPFWRQLWELYYKHHH